MNHFTVRQTHTHRDIMTDKQKLMHQLVMAKSLVKSNNKKIKKALELLEDLLKLTRSILQECDKDPDKNDLAIKYLLNQRQLLNKLKGTLES